MARRINKLSVKSVASIAKTGWHGDGGGLYLQVSSFGTKSWIFRYTLAGRTRPMGLGPVDTVSLAAARLEAERCRQLLREGVDPIEHRKAARAARLAEAAKRRTFRECAEGYIKAHSAGWRNAKHAQQWENTLKTYAYPVFGDLPIDAVDAGLVVEALEPIWTVKTETASRLRGRIERILDWASTRGYRSGENPARWRGHVQNLLPAPSKVRKVKHHAALPYTEVAGFLADLRGQDGVAALGLEFLILTAARTQEVIGARWDQFDLDAREWAVPAEIMKSGKPHRAPLSAAALAVLESAPKVERSGFVFPGGRAGRGPLSNMAFLELLRRMKRDDITVHGFRSTFKDWAAETTGYPNEVSEMALAHAVGDKVEAAYRRGDLFEKRRRLMDDWAGYCSTVERATAEVVSLRS